MKQHFSNWKSLLAIVQPNTVIKWHRALARKHWKRKSKGPKPGRPKIDKEIQDLIHRMAKENRTWGAGRIYGELKSLGFEISERTVARYLPKNPEKGLSWKSFLKNQCSHIVAIDFFTVFTASFKQLYGLVVIDHKRRKILFTNATFNPSYDWIILQLTQAFPGECPYKYLICDNDKKFAKSMQSDLRSLFQVELKSTSFRSPWQNGICERVIGTIRRECLDHVVIINEGHLRSVLTEYTKYYNENRPHRSLGFFPPVKGHQAVVGYRKKLAVRSFCNGLHTSYTWLSSA